MSKARDFVADLSEQLDFLHASIERFDAGHEHEAKRIATAVRLLLHDSGQTPLMRELGARDELEWLSMGTPYNPANLAVTNSLVSMRVQHSFGGSFESLATVPGHPLPWARWLSFDSWWKSEPVIHLPQTNHSFARRSLVLMLANRDGGAHVGRLQPAENKLAAGEFTSWSVDFGQGIVDVMQSPVPASLRTIGAEVLATVDRHRSIIGF